MSCPTVGPATTLRSAQYETPMIRNASLAAAAEARQQRLLRESHRWQLPRSRWDQFVFRQACVGWRDCVRALGDTRMTASCRSQSTNLIRLDLLLDRSPIFCCLIRLSL